MSDTPEMVERVLNAMQLATVQFHSDDRVWGRECAIAMARAAIAAMREDLCEECRGQIGQEIS